MIFNLNERETETLKKLNEIKERCNLHLNGNTKFLIEDLTDIKALCDFIAEDNFNRLASEY